MKEDSEGSSWGLPIPIPTLVALVAVVASFFATDRRLTSSRPRSEAEVTAESRGKFEARLWQDPFAIWASLEKSQGKIVAEPWLGELNAEIVSHVANYTNVLILPVMLAGGWYAENVESRIRSRHAVLASLGAGGFVPEDSEYLGGVRVCWPDTASVGEAFRRGEIDELSPGCDEPCPAINLTYEWFRRRDFDLRDTETTLYKRILVMWLDEAWFEDQPIYRLAQMVKSCRADAKSPLPFCIVGPRHSGTIREMLPQRSRRPWQYPYPTNHRDLYVRENVFTNVTLFSAVASAIDELVHPAAYTNDPPLVPREAITEFFARELQLNFRNFSRTDGELLEAMLGELEARDVSPKDWLNHAVIVSEWDTFYGRMMPLTFAAQATRRPGDSLNKAIERWRGGKSGFTNIHFVTYLRGIDGKTAKQDEGEEDKKKPKADKAESPSSEMPAGNVERDSNEPESGAQFDYINRVALNLEKLDSDLKDRCPRGLFKTQRIRVIGIVGSDPYDTLSILQALRPRFPEVTFFTSDLDARMFHPSQLQWTRNLLVTSSYGLQLNQKLQRNIPPFRESLQTAQFLAVRAALSNSLANTTEKSEPRIFEIGRDGPVDLSNPADASGLHPPVYLLPQWPSGWTLVGWSLAAVSLCCLLLLFRPVRYYTFQTYKLKEQAILINRQQVANLEKLLKYFSSPDTDSVLGPIRDALSKQQDDLLPPPGTAPKNRGFHQYAEWFEDRCRTVRILDVINERVLRSAEILTEDRVKKSKLVHAANCQKLIDAIKAEEFRRAKPQTEERIA